jgi:hypothetical protein
MTRETLALATSTSIRHMDNRHIGGAEMKIRHGIITVFVGIALFVAGFGVMFWAVSGVRSEPEYSTFQTSVAPRSESIIEIEATDARYEFSFRSGSRFDFALLTDKAITQYKAGEQYDVGDQAMSITRGDTFIQTGSGHDFALLFANRGNREIVVNVNQTLFQNPSGFVGYASVISILLGFVLAVAGAIFTFALLIVRGIRGSGKRLPKQVEQSPLSDSGTPMSADVSESGRTTPTDSIVCSSCGAEVRERDKFCGSCGKGLTFPDHAPSQPIVSPMRIVVMTVLTFGLYVFYWVYLTWKQYRDFTQEEAYPLWHTLSLFVPVYSLFQLHAHVQEFKDLMTDYEVRTTLNPGLAVVVSMLVGATSVLTFFTSELATVVIYLLYIGMITGLLLHLQRNLNALWNGVSDESPRSIRVTAGQWAFIAIGILSWMGTLIALVEDNQDSVGHVDGQNSATSVMVDQDDARLSTLTVSNDAVTEFECDSGRVATAFVKLHNDSVNGNDG